MPAPYELWQTRKSLGVMRGVKRITPYWGQWFTNQYLSEEDYIDFEKIPVPTRKLAPFVMPLAQGKPVWDAKQIAYRFKPAYVKVDDAIDPLKPLMMQAGIDSPILDGASMDPMARLEAIKVAITAEHVNTIERRLEWLRAKAIIDGKVTIKGEDYPETLVDFQRRQDFTEVLTSGNRWGDSGVSIFDHIQRIGDAMADDEFGGVVTRVTLGSNAWKVARKDQEFLDHLDTNIRNPTAEVRRGLIGFEKIQKVGELQVGGASGSTIELWLNNETFVDPDTGLAARYVGANDIVATASAEAVMGVDAFGRIIDQDARYQAVRIWPTNYEVQKAELKVQRIAHKSAPLCVPINPNATYKATVTNL